MNKTCGIVMITLSKAQATIDQLNQLIETKLLKHTVGETSKARRRAWGRNKSKIQRFRDDLLQSRENLLAALTANSS